MVQIPDTSTVAPSSITGSPLWRNLAVLPLPAFFMDRYEVTNREFKRFVDAGGYSKEEYWRRPFVKTA
jgi:formylglycine-generating enzyme required for sulfatase activity